MTERSGQQPELFRGLPPLPESMPDSAAEVEKLPPDPRQENLALPPPTS